MKYAVIHKRIGETPLQALERFRAERVEDALQCVACNSCDETKGEVAYWKDVPMTYAGRLDPMAEGVLVILIGSECAHKSRYIGLDKEYEVDILCGITTDSYDLLGMPHMSDQVGDVSCIQSRVSQSFMNTYVGTFTQAYPAYSSKTINGHQLHELARAGDLPERMPTKEVRIHAIDLIDIHTVTAPALLSYIKDSIAKVQGDFRQKDIGAAWQHVLTNESTMSHTFVVIRIRVLCSSGTYMRSLAHRIGRNIGVGACAYSIRRTKIVGLPES